MATLGEGQAGEREAEQEDVYHTGMLFFKTGTFTNQQYLAQLKFESASGPKRIDFYPLHINPVSPGAPSATIPLTHVLTVSPSAGIMKGKHSFQILTTKGKFQLGAGSLEDKVKWMEKIEQMCKNLPLGDRTYEFHVKIHPTAHSDRLRLQGQYLLKVTINDIKLFTASGALPTRFWSPLMHVQKAHCCVLPAVNNGLGVQQYGGLYGSSDSTTQSLLIISTESTSPVGNGGFVFVTQSAADTAAIINHRRTMVLSHRAAATPPTEAGTTHPPSPPPQPLSSQAPPSSVPQETVPHWQTADSSTTDFRTRPPKRKAGQMHSVPFGPTQEREQGDRPTDLHSKKNFENMSKFERTWQSLYTQKSKERNSFQRSSERVSARRPQNMPLKEHHQNGRSLHLELPDTSFDNCSLTMTPEEPRYITNRELADIRKQWQDMATTGGGGQQQGDKMGAAVISPEERAYYNGEFVKAVCAVYPWKKEEEKAAGHGGGGNRGKNMSEGKRQSSKTKGLERQAKIDVLSPMQEEEEEEGLRVPNVRVRPRSNAFSETMENFQQPQYLQHQHGKPFPLPRKQTAPALFQGDGKLALLQAQHQRRTEMVLHCTEEECRLVPKQPPLAETRQKSSSDPLLRELRSPESPSHEYLTIIHVPQGGKKPVPTPRTSKPPPMPAQPQVKLAPPQPSSQPLYSNLGFDILLSSQRSISEFNLHSLTSEDLYENTQKIDNDLPTPYVSIDDEEPHSHSHLPLPSRHGIFQRQKSGSTGDIPSCPGWTVTTEQDGEREDPHKHSGSYNDRFLHTEELYENGKECMDYWMYGSMECRQQSWPTMSRGDSGIECTPNSSPFLTHKSFSMNDLRQADGEEVGGGGWGEEVREDGYDTQPGTGSESEEDTTATASEGGTPPRPPVPTPRPCVFQMCGRTSHAAQGASPRDPTRVYENLPLLTC